VGRVLTWHGNRENPLFVVGSSGVEMALAAHWGTTPRRFAHPGDAGPIIAVCGSFSPVTAAQIRWAAENGFDDVPDVASAVRSLRGGRSVVVHSRDMKPEQKIGPTLGKMLREVIEATKVGRAIIAGGDTSGAVARE